jgi:hypothetical protein
MTKIIRSDCEPREPGKGANVFRLPWTHGDALGSFHLARGSLLDSVRPSQTHKNYMACRRSGVRIPLAPPIFVHVFG